MNINFVHYSGEITCQSIKLVPIVIISLYIVKVCRCSVFPEHIETGLNGTGIAGKLNFGVVSSSGIFVEFNRRRSRVFFPVFIKMGSGKGKFNIFGIDAAISSSISVRFNRKLTIILFVHLAIPIGTFNEDNLLFLTIHLIDHLDSYIIRPFLLTKNIAIFIEVILFTQISLGIVSIINPIMIHIFIISNLDRNITG